MRKVVWELYEARLNRTLWQIVYEFDRERAEAALEHLRQRYGVSEDRLWERRDELYLTWLAFRLADELEAYLKSGAGREFKTKEAFGDLLALGRWLPVDLAPLFWLRLVGDAEGEAEFRAAWVAAVNKWLEGMAAPYSPKKPAVARKAVELFNAFTGAGFKYEELFPPPPKPAEAARPETAAKPEAVKPVEAKREAVKPETAKPEAVKPAKAAKPEAKPVEPVAEIQKPERGLRREEKPTVKPEAGGPVGQKPPADTAVEGVVGRGLRREVEKPETAEAVKPAEAAKPETKPAQKPTVEVERGLRREVEKATAKPEIKPTEVKKPEAVKPAEPAAEAVERGLRREEKPKAPIADVIPERVEAVEYLVQRFGVVLDREAAFKAKDFVIAKVKARLEKVAVREPEFAHILAEVAEHVLSSFGRLMASPDAAMYVHEALFYYFEGYQTKDGELLFARIERTVREAVRRAEEAGIPDAEYRIKQFILEIIDILATAGERYRRDALKAVSTVEKALRATAFAGLSATALYSVYHGLYSEAVVSSVATAVALADVGRFKEAVEYVQKAAKTLYEAAREVFEKVKVTAQRLVELFVEAVVRALAWIDEHKAYLFLMAAVAAGAIALSVALNLWGLVEMEKLAHAAMGAPPFFARLAETGGKAAERFRVVAERWRVDEDEKQKIEEVINAPQNRERPFSKLTSLKKPPKPLAELRRALKNAKNVKDEAKKDAAVVATLVLYKTLVKNAEVYREWTELYKWARGLVEKQEFTVTAEEVKRLREAHRRLEEVAEEVRRELNAVLTLYMSHDRGLYEKLRPHLEVDVKRAEELAEARSKELSEFGDVNMGTKAYAALLSVARGGLYGHVAMLLMGEGALADMVISTPRGAYNKAERVAEERGETVDPSYSGRRGRSVGQPSWEDRAASALLRYLLGRAVDEDLMFRRVGEGFEVFRAYGGIETRVDVLKIREVVRSKAGEEEPRRFMEEAKRTAPDLSGLDKAPQYLEWRTTDVSTFGGRIVAGTAHTWQAAWYVGLLGEEESISGRADVTEEGVKPIVTMYWPREREDQILRESRWLEFLLGRRVESWRELVDAIDWSWVLRKVEELADELKPWIGPQRASDAERERLMKRMLGELALLAHFAETRRGMDYSRWREERAKKLARAVEALSSGRIAGEYAERLAQAIILYAEGRKKKAKKSIESLAGKVGNSKEEVWNIVQFVLGDMYCLAKDCARDEVVRKFVAPALELVMLDKALRGEFDREKARLLFGEMYATAIAGDGHVGPDRVQLTVGGELGGGAALLRLATLHLLNQLLSDEWKFGVRAYIGKGRYYYITATSENAVWLKRLLAVSAPSAGGEYLSPKFNEFVKEARVEVRFGNIRRADKGRVAADLIISEAGVAVKYNVYLRDSVELEFKSTDRGRAELAARLLRSAGVSAEVKKVDNRDEWYVYATTDRLAAGREELRDAVRKVVEEALKKGWVDEKKAERWLEKLEEGRVLKEGWPKYHVVLAKGALVVSFSSTNPASIEQEAQRLRDMGLVEGKHFTVKMPEESRYGYIYILKEGLAYAARLSEYGSGRQRKLAAEFVEYILQRAEEEGDDVYEKAKKIIEEGMSRGSRTLKGFEGRVEVGGSEYVVKVIGGSAEFDEGKSGKKLLRIKITAEVGGVRSNYTITFGRYGGDNTAVGFAYARADAPGIGEAERLAALIKALTGKEPKMYHMKNRIMLVCYREHLEGFKRYAELADAIERWLEETSRR
jgi:hypothetical protein